MLKSVKLIFNKDSGTDDAPGAKSGAECSDRLYLHCSRRKQYEETDDQRHRRPRRRFDSLRFHDIEPQEPFPFLRGND